MWRLTQTIPKRCRGPTLVSGTNLLCILASGAAEWNAFRDRNPDWVMLNRACLPEAQLVRANLRRAFLQYSNLYRANLEAAHLECAILRNSNLRGTNLRGAKIDNADLCDADLCKADLRGASMSCCFLRHTDLRGADLSTAEGLTYAQIVKAHGDHETRLPTDVPRPASWAEKGAAL